MVLNYLFNRFFGENEKYLDEIKASEVVKVKTDHYDDYYTHEVVWEDIYNVYHLAKESSKESIEKLKNKYDMRYKSHSVRVKLRTPNRDGIFSNYDDSPYYTSFSMDEVKKFYVSVLKDKEHEKEVKNRMDQVSKEEERKNTTDELIKEINKTMKK